MSTMEQALRDHGLIVLQVKDVERLLGRWKHREHELEEARLDDIDEHVRAGRYAVLIECIQDLEELTAPRA